MVLAREMTQLEHDVITFHLPAGHALTEENLHQLASHHGVGALVNVTDPRTPEQRLSHASRQAARVEMVFRHADLRDPAAQALVQALLACRSA